MISAKKKSVPVNTSTICAETVIGSSVEIKKWIYEL